MKLIRMFGVVASLVLATVSPGPAHATEGLKLYVFGNSLVHHKSDTEETAVPYWLARFAEADGKRFSVDGEWGFLRDFSASGTPKAQWSFKGADRAWTRDIRNFADVGYDVVMVNPANFIQYKPSDQPFDGENAARETPLTATVAIANKANAQRFVIYEGWADMSAFLRSFPPKARQLRRYHEFNKDDYHDWYVDYRRRVQTALPETDVELIPVASILSKLFTEGPLQSLPVEALYVDDSPHGTPTLYFLAGAITYAALFETLLPEKPELPDTLNPDLRNQYPEVRAFIHDALGIKETAQINPKQVNRSTSIGPTARQAAQPLPGLGLANPSLAMGTSAIADWSTEQPFLDLMKSARPWVGHKTDQWGAVSAEDLEYGGFFDENGWIWGIPPGLEAVETLILTDQPEAFTSLEGRYRLTYSGVGEITVTGRARVQSREDGEIWFEYRPGDGVVGIRIEQTDPMRTGDYIHNISVVREDQIDLFDAGMQFNPDWLARVGDLRLLRFMDWMATNHSPISEWNERPLVNDFSYAWRGVPVETMVALGNQIGADIWLTLPHMASNNYAAEMARLVKTQLLPERKVYVEFSNEVWNFTFAQAEWAREQASQRWGKKAGSDGWMQFAGMRAAEISRIWEWEFGDEAGDRLVRVVSVHTGWKGLEQAQLEAPLWLDEARSNPAPVTAFDAYAVSGYFGLEIGSTEGAERSLSWINDSMQSALSEAMGRGLKRAAMQDYVRDHLYDAAIPVAARSLNEGSLDELLTDLLPYHAKVAKDNGLDLIMYEGGTHVVGHGEWIEDQALTSMFIRLNYSPEMGQLYERLLDGWRSIEGATLFNAYNDVSRPGKWGSWGALRHLDDSNPRHDALVKSNNSAPTWKDQRADGAFLHGGVFRGTDAIDVLAGTMKHDALLGGAGDDTLIAAGTRDNLHGGEGYDVVELTGSKSDFEFETVGDHVIARSGTSEYTMYQVEAVRFSNNPETVVELTQSQ